MLTNLPMRAAQTSHSAHHVGVVNRACFRSPRNAPQSRCSGRPLNRSRPLSDGSAAQGRGAWCGEVARRSMRPPWRHIARTSTMRSATRSRTPRHGRCRRRRSRWPCAEPINSTTAARLTASSEAVGSSRIRIAWLPAKPRRMLTRCCSPPEKGRGRQAPEPFRQVELPERRRCPCESRRRG